MSNLVRQLNNCFEQLDENNQNSVLNFAEFLLQRQPVNELTIVDPENIPRPENEKVVAAIKRLSATYPMIEKNNVFDKSSQLMTEHMLNGRDAETVIDELEAFFAKEYQHYRQHLQQQLEQVNND